MIMRLSGCERKQVRCAGSGDSYLSGFDDLRARTKISEIQIYLIKGGAGLCALCNAPAGPVSLSHVYNFQSPYLLICPLDYCMFIYHWNLESSR